MTGAAGSPKAWNLPNALTVLRVLLVPLFAWLLLREGGADTASRIAAFVTFGFAALTDKADGEIARRRGLITDFGRLADPIADKALIGTALIGLSVLGSLPWWVTGLVLVRELGITVLRFAVIKYGVIAAGPGGKAKTLLQVIAIGLYLLPLTGFAQRVAVVVMAAAVLVTVMTGLDYVGKAIRLRADGRRAARTGGAGGGGPAGTAVQETADEGATAPESADGTGSPGGIEGPRGGAVATGAGNAVSGSGGSDDVRSGEGTDDPRPREGSE